MRQRSSTPPELLDRVAALRGPTPQGQIVAHRIFTAGSWNANIIGQRTASREADAFDDWMHLIWKDGDGVWEHYTWQITTDPGTYWLQNPEHVDGTAILVPAQYRSAYGIGLHRGQYTAVCQIHGKVAVYRDHDRDNVLDPTVPMQWGFFGINHHRANASRVSTTVEKWSAGCQVFASPVDFAEYLRLVKVTTSVHGPKVTYTLIGD